MQLVVLSHTCMSRIIIIPVCVCTTGFFTFHINYRNEKIATCANCIMYVYIWCLNDKKEVQDLLLVGRKFHNNFLPPTHCFTPIAFESLVPLVVAPYNFSENELHLNLEILKLHAVYLLQRLSVAVQRGNCALTGIVVWVLSNFVVLTMTCMFCLFLLSFYISMQC